jgi:hypothetical protein
MSNRDPSGKTPRDLTRRSLIQWSLAAGAALGVSHARIADVLSRTGGNDLADAATATPTKRSVHLRAGEGALAWFTLLWPHNDIAAGAAGNTRTTWPFAAAQTRKIQGTGGELTLGPNTPFANAAADRQMTVLMAGRNETHTRNPNSVVRSVSGNSMFALVAELQQSSPTVIPVITIDDVQLGTAPGAPRAAVVPTGADIVGLFNSAASRAGGLLDKARAGHADLYRAHYETLAQLNRAAGRTTMRDAYATARGAAKFLGTNLASKLEITATDEAAYGIDGSMRPEIQEIARTLIVTAKAFQLRLTSSVVLPALRDDPHGAFADMTNLNATTAALKRVLDAFMADLAGRTDDVTGTPLSEDIVITIEGDTPKTPLDRTNWLDDTPEDSNWVYVYGGGKLKTGWFGGISRTGAVTGFDPKSGATTTYDGDLQAQATVAAVAYAVTRGDAKRTSDLVRMDISGIIAPT